jgi:adenylate cyclase
VSFYAELKRRNVFRVAAAYLVVGWLLLQLTAILLSLIGAPEWVGKTIIALLILGFVPAVAAAWVFDVGPDGIRRDDGSPRDDGPQARRLDMITLGAVVLLFVIMGWQHLSPAYLPQRHEPVASGEPAPIFYAPESPKEAGTPARIDAPASQDISPHSIAVLPFANVSPDPDNAYFADGIAEEVLSVLARVEGLRVASRTSSFAFRGGAADVGVIASRLGVAHVLEGSVRRQGQQVRITAQLIDARRDQPLWSSTYDRQLQDIFAIQEEIAQSIADALRDTLGVRAVTVRVPTSDLQAYELYLRGRQLFAQRGAGLPAARAQLEQAVERDPGFAAAWATLAAVYRVTPGYLWDLNQAEANAMAADAAERALGRDAEQPLALGVKGMLAVDGGDFLAAYRLQRRALQIDPNDANGWLWLGITQFRAGHLRDALASVQRARQLDPLTAIHVAWEGGILGLLGERETGDRLLEQAAQAPFAAAWWWWARLNQSDGSGPEVAAAYQRFLAHATIPHDVPLMRALDPVFAALAGEITREQAGRLVQEAIRRHPDEDFTIALMVLEQHREALDEALRTVGWANPNTALNIWHPQDRPFRELPGFLDYAERTGHLRLWEEFGYPDFCRRVEAPQPHLECTQ